MARHSSVGRRILLAKTCSRCGELKQGHEFSINNHGYYLGDCDHCKYLYAKESTIRANHASQDHAHKNGDPWTSGDLVRLAELLNLDLPYKEIAKRLGRTINAITVAKNRYIEEVEDGPADGAPEDSYSEAGQW
jgi:hypothetical protein